MLPSLPLPGSPSCSWPQCKARLSAYFTGGQVRVCVAFWLFGLINNVLYVIILSAALDLVGPSIPKAAVLLFDVVPSFFVKLTAPYYIHVVPYRVRILLLAALSASGMFLIALTPSSVLPVPGHKPGVPDKREILIKMSGVVLASISSGAGELSFLGLTHFYGSNALASWGSGTGGAGLIGAGAYVLATTTIGLTVKTSLLAFSFLPLIMLLSFFLILPKDHINRASMQSRSYTRIPDAEDHDDGLDNERGEGLLSQPSGSPSRSQKPVPNSSIMGSLRTNLGRARGLFWPYMVPLFLVYVAEYTINQGVAPTLLFPLDETPFSQYRAFYPTYGALYQVGVFVSRSSLPFIRIQSLYTPTLLQCLNLAVLTVHAIRPFIPNIYVIFAIVLWEGLLGGLVYVSTFRRIREEVAEQDREFSLGATTVSDSAGICIAGVAGLLMEPRICARQVALERPWCRQL